MSKGGLVLLAVLMLTVIMFPGFGISAIAVVLIHELGHLLCATWIGTKIKAAGITGKGIYLRISPAVPRQNVSIALAGPLASLLIAIALPLGSLLALGNMIMFVVNVLPLPGLRWKKCDYGAETEPLIAGWFDGDFVKVDGENNRPAAIVRRAAFPQGEEPWRHAPSHNYMGPQLTTSVISNLLLSLKVVIQIIEKRIDQR